MRIGFRWLEGDSQGTIDLFEVEDLTKIGAPRIVEHEVLTESGKHSAYAICIVRTDAGEATLDYQSFSEMNVRAGIDLGVTRLTLGESPEPRITKVEWKDRDSDQYKIFSFEAIKRKNRISKASELAVRLNNAVVRALHMTQSELEALLPTGVNIPRKLQTTATVFDRNPFVIAATLRRAGGKCEGCGTKEMFISKVTGEPYLEVHHVTFLADQGSDSTANTLALCPNCHRKRHHEREYPLA